MEDALLVARQCAQTMWADDQASRFLGMELIEVTPGRARLDMLVTPAMTNGHGMCHGGFIFTLADSAFAFACNTYGERVVASHCSITYLSPGRGGERLCAIAQERARSGRSGLYDVQVCGADGRIVAEFRGHSRIVGTFSRPNSEPV